MYAAPALSRLLDLCADAVEAVAQGRSLNDLLPQVPLESRPGVQALVFHVMRWWGSAQAARARLAPRTPPPRVDSLLCSALALLWPHPSPPYPDHTVVDEAVDAARRRSPAAAGFVNAVLRRFLRERDAVAAAAASDLLGAWNHPPWWVERLRRDWPAQWQALLLQANRHPPMTLRVNARRATARDYAERLAARGLKAQVLTDATLGGQAVLLERACAVTSLPGFAEGEVSVQDASAQRAAPLLLQDVEPAAGAVEVAPLARPKASAPGQPRSPSASPPAAAGLDRLPAGSRVLDACAAPGGKTAHLLERADLQVVALDHDAPRLERLRGGLQRLGLQALTLLGDASQPRQWWDGQLFDAILLDAPCSASGIVSRHPDVRWLRRPQDIAQLAQTQSRMLEALWPLLRPGGRLLYATCSIFKAEGEQRIDAFLQRIGGGAVRLEPASPGHLLPVDQNVEPSKGSQRSVAGDGFYYALMHKTA